MEHKRTATATGLYDSFCHIFFYFTQFLITFICLSKKFKRGGNCLLVPERSYGPVCDDANRRMPERDEDSLTSATYLLAKRREMMDVEQQLTAQKQV